MKPLLSALTLILFSSITWGQSVEVSSFSEVSTHSGLNVHLIKSQEERVEVEMRKGNFKDLVIEVRKNKLHIKVKPKGFWNSTSTAADIDVYYKYIDDLDASSGSSIDSEDVLETKKLDVDISSGASINLEVDADIVDADISSGSTLTLSGITDEQKIDISSGASYIAKALKSKKAAVDASSGSSATVNCTMEIRAEASSGATINYFGNPKEKQIDTDKWSGGSITNKG